MENNQKRGNAAVDDILQELKAKSGQPAAPGSRSVDDILEELKKPKAPPQQPVAVHTPSAAPVSTPVAPVSAAPAVAASAPAASTAPAASPTPKVDATPVQKPKTPAETAPSEPEEKPVPRKKRDDKNATIWDIDIEAGREDMGPRIGKAAALDKVDKDKFTGDTELLSWFSDEDEGQMPTSKKELKKIEKMKKKRAAEERRAAKRRRKGIIDAEEDEEESLELGLEEDTFSEDAFEDVDAFDDDEDDYDDKPKKRGLAALFGRKKRKGTDYSEDDFGNGDGEDESEPDNVHDSGEPRAESWEPTNDFFNEGANTAVFDAIGFEDATAPPAPEPVAANVPIKNEPDVTDKTTVLPHTSPTVSSETRTFDPPRPTVSVAATTAAAMAAVTGAVPAPEKTQAFNLADFGTAEVLVEVEPVPHLAPPSLEERDTKNFDLDGKDDIAHVPTAAFTQEFGEDGLPIDDPSKNLFVDDMVDDRFREFFGETVVVDKETEDAMAKTAKEKGREKRRRNKKGRSAVLTGEFGKLAEQAERAERAEQGNVDTSDDFDDYNHLQDADAIEEDIRSLCSTLTSRFIFTLLLAGLLFYMGLAYTGTLPFPEIGLVKNQAVLFASVYLAVLLGSIVLNFTTVASGLVGLAGEPTVDTPPALAAVVTLLQGIMLLVNALSNLPPADVTLFGALAALLLSVNALGKRVRAASILGNFHLASAGHNHSAAYVVDSTNDLAFNITSGLNEEYPTLLVSRPTALVKGFLRQSFSQRTVDRRARALGWVLLAAGLGTGIIAWVMHKDLFIAISSFAAILCIAAPLSSSLVSGIPSLLMQRGAERVGAVVPGWSAIEELGEVNVVMAGARDIFPPSSVVLKGIKTFEKERIDLAILYAASVLIEGCDTLRDIFMAVIQGKSDMLYKVESLTREPQRGFTAWVQNSRVVIGTREMMQKHDIEPPTIETEMKLVPEGYMPVYLGVSGKLFAMFIIGYKADAEVRATLNGLVKSGVSLLVDSSDMNVSNELIEQVYGLPVGAIKVLNRRELNMLDPLTSYLPESDGVMTHIGTFQSFIGGMRAAAACAAGERMANIVQIASVLLACVLCLLLVLSDGLSVLSLGIMLAYQLGWTLLVSALPAVRKY